MAKLFKLKSFTFLRNEHKFDSVEILQQQLKEDQKKSLEIIRGTFFE